MRVWLAADDSACGYWRMRLPQAHLDEVEFVDVETVTARYLEDDVLEVEPPVAVFQRPVRARALELIEALQRAGTAVVVEMDDDLRYVHPDNYGYLSMIGRFEDIHWSHAELAAQRADLVIASTPALARRYGAHGRVVVIQNYLPSALLEIKPEHKSWPLLVGWAGSTAYHPGDLEVTYGGVAAACTEAGASFRVVGDARGANDSLGIPVIEQTGMIEQELFHAQVAQLDTGIVPLQRSRFNDAKSNLKGLEYAALGVPFVASPTPEYERLADQGAGRLAGPSWGEWRTAVLSCLDGRDEEAERGRAVVREHYLIEDNAWRWAEAWERAERIARNRSSVIDTL
jgi:glycosyltransferase involved in cell wall biosynthesis